MKKSMIVSIALFLTTFGCQKQKEKMSNEYAIGTPKDLLPLSKIERGKRSGVNIDIINHLSQMGGWDVDLYATPYFDLIPGLLSGSIDVAMGLVSKGLDKWEDITFIPYLQSYFILIHNGALSSTEDLSLVENKTIGLLKGRAMESGLRESGLRPKQNILKYFNSFSEILRQIQSGKNIDFGIVDYVVGKYLLEMQYSKLQILDLNQHTEYNYVVAVNENSRKGKEFLKNFNETFVSLKKGGNYLNILKRYFL